MSHILTTPRSLATTLTLGHTDRRPVCYIAGPMRGYANFNFPAFQEATNLLCEFFEVQSPHLNDIERGLPTSKTGDPADALPLREYMKVDLQQVLRSDAVFVLPGWSQSKGACLEAHVAFQCEIPVWQLNVSSETCRLVSGDYGLREDLDPWFSQEDPEEREPRSFDVDEYLDLNDQPLMRTFETGATRNNDASQPDYEGFISPIVIEAYGRYMNRNRLQADGTIRDSDNWQKGIPRDAYMKSGWRHFHDWWLEHRGYDSRDGDIETAICGLLFNSMGYLHEYLKQKETAHGDR